MLIADNGVIIRTPVEQISSLSRVSQGVKVMRLKEENKIVGVALVKKEEEEEEIKEELEQFEGEINLTNEEKETIINSQIEAQADDEE